MPRSVASAYEPLGSRSAGAGRPVRFCGRYTESFHAAYQGTRRWTDTSSRCLHPEVRLSITAGLLYPPWMGVLLSGWVYC
jgi:hypothetical protein